MRTRGAGKRGREGEARGGGSGGRGAGGGLKLGLQSKVGGVLDTDRRPAFAIQSLTIITSDGRGGGGRRRNKRKEEETKELKVELQSKLRDMLTPSVLQRSPCRPSNMSDRGGGGAGRREEEKEEVEEEDIYLNLELHRKLRDVLNSMAANV